MKINYLGKNLIFKNIRIDSRKVEKGDLFVAISGTKIDGHDFIEKAKENGATVIIGEKDYNLTNVTYIKVNNSREAFSHLCSLYYGSPEKKLKFIGVTGTDGKTTTSSLIFGILKSAGFKVGLVSTISAKIGNKNLDTGFHTTTPDADLLFELLAKMVHEKIEYVVLEVTSHGLAQKRIFPIEFEISVVTNVTPEHLDYHKTYEQLLKDKALIFEISKLVVLNKFGRGFKEIKKFVPTEKFKNNKVLICEELIDAPLNFKINFPGDYNLQNASLAHNVCSLLHVSEKQIIEGLDSIKSLEGRFERIKNNLGINIVVDFAHTENALENLLSSVSKIKKPESKVITVFGCAGERDIQKRPKMGFVASKYSDKVILTAEDPRGEGVVAICNDIASGNKKFSFLRETDRKEAIKKAISFAKKDDWVLICGKGHEKSMNLDGKTELPWSDQQVIRTILNSFKPID